MATSVLPRAIFDRIRFVMVSIGLLYSNIVFLYCCLLVKKFSLYRGRMVAHNRETHRGIHSATASGTRELNRAEAGAARKSRYAIDGAAAGIRQGWREQRSTRGGV